MDCQSEQKRVREVSGRFHSAFALRLAALTKPVVDFTLLSPAPFDSHRGFSGLDHVSYLSGIFAAIEIRRLCRRYLCNLSLMHLLENVLFSRNPFRYGRRLQPTGNLVLSYTQKASLTHRAPDFLRARQNAFDLRQLLQPYFELHAADIFKKRSQAEEAVQRMFHLSNLGREDLYGLACVFKSHIFI